MLTGLLDTIKQQFTSKSYWLGSMLPFLLFLFANGLLFRRYQPGVVAWLTAAESLQNAAFQYSAIVGVLLATAFVLSLLTSPMLAVLEGRHLGFLRPLLFRRQWARRRNLEDRSAETWKTRDELQVLLDQITPALSKSRRMGKGKGAPPKAYWNLRIWFEPESETRMHIARARFRMRHGRTIPPDLLRSAASGLNPILQRYDASLNLNRGLDAAQKDLVAAMEYALNRAEFDRIQILNEMQFHFPGERESAPVREEGPAPNRILAPTRLGNIGRTMQTYAWTRYGMDLNIFWTRLQNALQKDGTAYFSSLQDAKAQLDCTVTLVWFSALFTALWMILLLRVYGAATQSEFRLVMGAGTFATLASYSLACLSYRTFADVMRSCVDLFRLKVLDNLNIPQPYGTDEERRLWERLGDSIGHGAREEFRYKS